MSTTAELIASAADLWGTDGHVADPLAALVRASNLLGADRAVSNFGGGNTSAKGSAVDHTGNERSVMWVKGSGSDLATIGPQGFTVLRLQEVLPLIARAEMSDEEMVAHLVRCQFDPAMPRPWRVISSMPRSRCRAATEAETAGSVTTSSAAAPRTEPVRATARNVCSCPNVIARPA